MARSTRQGVQNAPIEAYLVHMNQKRREGQELDEDPSVLCRNVAIKLQSVRESFQLSDFLALDLVAREILEHALKIGAPDLLNLTIDLQTLSRCRDQEGISGMIRLLEDEVSRIEKFLSEDAG